MPEIVVTVARFGFLILLWIFVFAVVGVIRRDLFAGGRPSRLVAAPRANLATWRFTVDGLVVRVPEKQF